MPISKSNTPRISIITVVYNAESLIESTILSSININYKNKEYIIIDGDSKDNTKNIIERYKEHIDLYISEPDKGIYDAMNKGIKKSTGDWIILMNAGDVFNGQDVFDNINFMHSDMIEIYYSDTILTNNSLSEIEVARVENRRFIHQSFLYKKTLHDKYGYYLINKKLSISDYLFFSDIWSKNNSEKIEKPISIFLCGGLSSNDQHFYQKIGVDILYNNTQPYIAAFKILTYPLYKKIMQLNSKIKITWKNKGIL